MQRQFGTMEALLDLERLYARVESSPLDPALGPAYGKPDAAKIRRVPRSWMPPRFATWGGHGDSEIFVPGEVMVHYSPNDALVAIEFFGRHGCFVSRDAAYLPSQFKALYRLAERPLFVTARILDEGD